MLMIMLFSSANRRKFNFDQMCPGVHCNWLSAINFLLSATLLIMNGVHAIWGMVIKYQANTKRDDMKSYMDKLELYLNIVSYSDSVLVPLEVIMSIIVKKCCCPTTVMHRNRGDDDGGEDDGDGFDVENPRGNAGGSRCGSYSITKSYQPGRISTFQATD